MTKLLASSALALAAFVALGRTAHAEGGGGGVANSIGVGVESQLAGSLSGVSDLSVQYDGGAFHAGGFFGLSDPAGRSNTAFEVGGRFFYHVHRTASADFSLGASLGIDSAADPAGGSVTAVFLEPSFQIRWFAASNVALSFTGGFSIGLDDDKDFSIGGQLTGVAGIHYYFTK